MGWYGWYVVNRQEKVVDPEALSYIPIDLMYEISLLYIFSWLSVSITAG